MVGEAYPVANTPLIELDNGAGFDLAVVKSPKSVALPVLAIVT